MGGSIRNGGVSGCKEVCGSLRCESFTNFSQNLSIECKYAVKLSITDLIKISRKGRKRYSGRLWKTQMWYDSYCDGRIVQRWGKGLNAVGGDSRVRTVRRRYTEIDPEDPCRGQCIRPSTGRSNNNSSNVIPSSRPRELDLISCHIIDLTTQGRIG